MWESMVWGKFLEREEGGEDGLIANGSRDNPYTDLCSLPII